MFYRINLFNLLAYSAFQIDELHRHNQNLVGTLHATSLLWSTDMKTAVNSDDNSCIFLYYSHFKLYWKTFSTETRVIVGLTQLLSPNIAQTLSVRGKYVTIISQPIKKTERHSCRKSIHCFSVKLLIYKA